jgi:hypothetical protein
MQATTIRSSVRRTTGNTYSFQRDVSRSRVPNTDRSSTQQSSSRPDPRARGTDDDYVFRRSGSIGGYQGEVTGGISGHPSDSENRSGYKEESVRSSGQQSSSRQDPRVRGKDEDVAGSQDMSGLSSRIPYTERDRRASIIPTETLETTAHSSKSRSPPNPMTSIPQRKEEDSPPYNTRGSGWGREGSSQPADPSHTKPYGLYSPTDTTRSPQYDAPYTHSSNVQGSLGSQRAENAWGAESSRPTGRNPSSNPSVGAMGSHPWGGQPTGPPHCVFFPPSLHYNF